MDAMSRWLAGAAAVATISAVVAGATAAPPPPVRGSCSIKGTAGNDVITTTSRRESVCAGRGNDRIYLRGGNDVAWAQAGNDIVYARNGRPDMISGGNGRDVAFIDLCDTVSGVERLPSGRRRCLGRQ